MNRPDWSFADHIARQVGKTYQICQAAKNIGAVVVTHNWQEARRISREYNITAVPSSTPNQLRGNSGPILFDTGGVASICVQYEELLSKLQRENNALWELLDEHIEELDFLSAFIDGDTK